MRITRAAIAAIAAGAVVCVAAGAWACGDRSLATWPSYPPGMARPVGAPDGNGREWRSRPLVRGGPMATYTGEPGADAYGAWGEEDQHVYVKVVHTVVSISPWRRITEAGLAHLERARNQWLAEHGYTGGVRTFRNTWLEESGRIEASNVQPRATIIVPEGTRKKRGFHVDAGRRDRTAAARLAALKQGGEPVRISLPPTASPSARAVCDARGGYLVPPGADERKVASSKP